MKQLFKRLSNSQWIKSACIRSIKTMAQTAVSMLTIGNMVTEIDWVSVVSISLTSGIVSVLTSIAGLPEVEEDE